MCGSLIATFERFTSDINMSPVHVFGFGDALPDLLRDTEAVREPGVYNNYVGSDSIVLGLVVERAVGRSLSRYLEGARNERRIIPSSWVSESLYRDESRLQPGENPDSSWSFGYGYQWWIPEEPEGDFVAIGIWGQYIYVHPRYNVVISKTSADYYFDERDHETIALFRELARWASSRR